MSRKCPSQRAEIGALSPIETKLLVWALPPCEFTDRRMALELNVPESTVKLHWRHLRHKLGVRTRGGAVALWLLSELAVSKDTERDAAKAGKIPSVWQRPHLKAGSTH